MKKIIKSLQYDYLKGEPMNITNHYEQHVALSKELKMPESFYEAREPHQENFELLYQKAQDQNITLSTAKDFLNTLSKEELSTLQNYTLLADDINVSSLDDEGAYNLLLHHYEKYDFNKDGLISNGIGKSTSLLPVNMPSEEKEVLVQTLNELDEKERFMAVLMLNPPKLQLLDNGTIRAKENDKLMNYEVLINRINRILNPLPGEYSSPSFQATMENFKEMFEKNMQLHSLNNQYSQHQNSSDAQLAKAKLFSPTS